MAGKFFNVRLIVGLLGFSSVSKGLLTDVPGVYGPIGVNAPNNGIDVSKFMKSRPSEFVHPGIWHTHEDLERIRRNVQNKVEPWASAYAKFSQDEYSQASYQMEGPHPVISRGLITNDTSFAHDVRAAWQNALMWYITKDQGHYNRSTTILDAWGTNLTNVIGTDRSLLIGLDGSLFVNAAEIMRWEGGWVESEAKWEGGLGFSVQLYWLFAQQSVVVGQANYGMASIKVLLDFAVYLDDVNLYNYGMTQLLQHPCAGLFSLYEPKTGQSSESGRDQAHAMTGLGWTAYAARTAQSQGSDVYQLGDNLLLKGAEYAAKYNLNNTVPYDPSWYRCEAVLVNGPWKTIAEYDRGITRGGPIWDILAYEYHSKRGLSAPWTLAAQKAEGFEGNPNEPDHPGWGDLIWAY